MLTIVIGGDIEPTVPNTLPTESNSWYATSTTSTNNNNNNNPIHFMGLDSNGYGRIRKDVLPLSPVRPPEPSIYHFPEVESPANNFTYITQSKVQERVDYKYNKSSGAYIPPKKTTKRGAIIIGGGHNGLVSAAYLAKQGVDVLVLERRHIIGGAAVTEEIIPGFKFSRASYLAGLLRPQIIKDLNLEQYGFKYLPRDPSSFTPTLPTSAYKGKYLLLGSNEQLNYQSIAQFSIKDAEAYPHYEVFLEKIRDVMQPLLDHPLPMNILDNQLSWKDRVCMYVYVCSYIYLLRSFM